MRRLGYLGVILALVATTAVAQTQPRASKAQTAASKAAADALIAKAEAADLFTNVTDNEALIIRHRASNLQCHFAARDSVREITIIPGLPRGGDILCRSILSRLDFEERLHISRPAAPAQLGDLFRAAVAEVLQAHPDAKPAAIEQLFAPPRGAPVLQSGAFTFTDGAGKPQYQYIGISIVRGWTVELRMTGPYTRQNAQVGGMLGENVLMSIIMGQ